MNKGSYKISVLGIISQALGVLEVNKTYYFKVLLFSALLMSGPSLLYYGLFEIPSLIGWLFAVVAWFTYAVVCHRLMLLPKDEVLRPYTLTITRRELMFSLNLFFIAVVVFLLAWVMSIPLILLFNFLSLSNWVIPLLMGVPQTYFLGRFCLVLPSIAIDERINLKQSWAVTKGNSLRIFCIIGIVPLFWFLLSLISGDSAEHTGFTYIIDILFVFLQPIVLAFEVFLVSLIYKDMKRHWAGIESPSLI